MFMRSVQQFYDALLSENARFYAAQATKGSMGLGIFASTELPPGDYPDLMGSCYRVTVAEKESLERAGEHSFVGGQDATNRFEYLGGPASLTNHACPPHNNAEIVTWSNDPTPGHKTVGVRILRHVKPGEEVLVDYGERWWSKTNINCACPGCK